MCQLEYVVQVMLDTTFVRVAQSVNLKSRTACTGVMRSPVTATPSILFVRNAMHEYVITCDTSRLDENGKYASQIAISHTV